MPEDLPVSSLWTIRLQARHLPMVQVTDLPQLAFRLALTPLAMAKERAKRRGFTVLVDQHALLHRNSTTEWQLHTTQTVARGVGIFFTK